MQNKQYYICNLMCNKKYKLKNCTSLKQHRGNQDEHPTTWSVYQERTKDGEKINRKCRQKGRIVLSFQLGLVYFAHVSVF